MRAWPGEADVLSAPLPRGDSSPQRGAREVSDQPVGKDCGHGGQVGFGHLLVVLVSQQRIAGTEVDGRDTELREACHVGPAELGQRVAASALLNQSDQILGERGVRPGRAEGFRPSFRCRSLEHAAGSHMLAIAEFGTGVRAIIRALASANDLSGAKR